MDDLKILTSGMLGGMANWALNNSVYKKKNEGVEITEKDAIYDVLPFMASGVIGSFAVKTFLDGIGASGISNNFLLHLTVGYFSVIVFQQTLLK